MSVLATSSAAGGADRPGASGHDDWVVVLVLLEVLGQVRDPLGQDRHLDLGEPGHPRCRVLGDDLLFRQRRSTLFTLGSCARRPALPRFGCFKWCGGSSSVSAAFDGSDQATSAAASPRIQGTRRRPLRLSDARLRAPMGHHGHPRPATGAARGLGVELTPSHHRRIRSKGRPRNLFWPWFAARDRFRNQLRRLRCASASPSFRRRRRGDRHRGVFTLCGIGSLAGSGARHDMVLSGPRWGNGTGPSGCPGCSPRLGDGAPSLACWRPPRAHRTRLRRRHGDEAYRAGDMQVDRGGGVALD